MDKLLTAAKHEGFPEIVFVHRASVEAAHKFFAARAPNERVIADTEGSLFAAFGLRNGTLLQLLGPTVWWRGLVALLKGNLVGKPSGNVAQMPGAFLVEGRKVLWQHRARHSGDHPKLAAALHALGPDAESRPNSGKQTSLAARKKMDQEHRKLLTEARDLQRNGDIQEFAKVTAKAEEIAKQLDALEAEDS